MDRIALPAELAHFVQQALARGTYQSEEELMAEAVRVLKARVSRQEALQQPNGSSMDTLPQTPDEYVHAIAQALDTGDPVQARTLALAGAEHYPQHAALRTYAQVLAPPHGHGRAGDAGLTGRGQGQSRLAHRALGGPSGPLDCAAGGAVTPCLTLLGGRRCARRGGPRAGHSADENPRMTLTLPDGQPFATGATSYYYRPATAQETTPRLVLEVAIDGIVTHAMVDTGGLYLVCHPGLATQLHLEPAEAISGPRTLLFRGVLVQGRLYRLTLTLLAQAGDDLTVQATAFVPEPQEAESWGDLPSILGFYGCLERVRFAVDPRTETFFFGPA